MSGRKARQGNPLPYPLPYPMRSQPLPLALRHPYPLRLVQRQPLTPASPLPRLIYFPLYSVTPCPLFKCPMQHLKDALTAAALTFLAWLMAVAFLSL